MSAKVKQEIESAILDTGRLVSVTQYLQMLGPLGYASKSSAMSPQGTAGPPDLRLALSITEVPNVRKKVQTLSSFFIQFIINREC
jgi:hypothetical protein